MGSWGRDRRALADMYQRVWRGMELLKVKEGNRCSWDTSFTFGGGNLSGHGTIRLGFMGVARHD